MKAVVSLVPLVSFVDLPVGVYSVSERDFHEYSSVSDVDGSNDNLIGVSLTFTNLNSTENDFGEMTLAPAK